MIGLLSIFCSFILLCVIRALRFSPNHLTIFELERQVKAGELAAQGELRFRQLRPTLIGLADLLFLIALAGYALLVKSLYSYGVTILILFVSLLLLMFISNRRSIQQQAERLWRLREKPILRAAETFRPLLQYFIEPQSTQPALAFHSKDELLHALAHDAGILSASERTIAQQALTYQALKIKDLMTPWASLKILGEADPIGPLVLDELHCSGQEYFPVVHRPLNQAVGSLSMRDVLPLRPDVQRAQDAMRTPALYISGNSSVDEVLNAFLQTKQHLFIVINETEENIGAITIDTVLRLIFGQRMGLDESNQYEDRRAIASSAGNARVRSTSSKQ